MTDHSILRNATEEELGRAVEENVYTMIVDMTRVLNSEIEEKNQLSRYLWRNGQHSWKAIRRD
jgi:hypothetical protein